MNQILRSSFEEPCFPIVEVPPKKRIPFFRYQFYFSVFVAIVALFSFAILFYSKSQKEQHSKDLLQTYQIATLYATTSHSAIPSAVLEENPSSIIGAIRIDSIRVHYPIVSSFSEEHLEIAPCRISGPLPNSVGNLCIAGHNYVDAKFFSRLHELNAKDIVWIYDLDGNGVPYEIYNKYEVSPDDLSCLEPSFKNRRELTLITCNNVTGNRLILKAVETEKAVSLISEP